MSVLRCNHRWGFPRRWPEFEGQRGVDVQTCVKCGARRVSLVQFGAPRRAEDPVVRPAEADFVWLHNNNS